MQANIIFFVVKMLLNPGLVKKRWQINSIISISTKILSKNMKHMSCYFLHLFYKLFNDDIENLNGSS